jgi:CubicO group peptidase (beta-lactamase class C family)
VVKGIGHRPARGPISHRRPWLLVVALICLLAAACTSPDRQQATATSHRATGPPERNYWPTAGWRTASPKDQGMDPAVVGELDTKVSGSYPQVRSLLVVRHGYVVYERYWHGLDASDGHDSFSVTKSFVSALVGIALADQHLQGLDQTVGELLAPHLPANADPRLRRVTVRQLSTMTAGLAGDDPSQGGDNQAWTGMLQSHNWLRHILSQRLVSKPGTEFGYSSASSHLLSAIVTETTGQSTLAYARTKLFGPLGIATDSALVQPIPTWPPSPAQLGAYEQAPVAWDTDPQGYQIGFSWLKLPARDLAKIGYLYLNGGRWDGTQVVPADYVHASTQSQSKPPPSVPADGYGYQWWTTTVASHHSFFAAGYAGQLIQVIPDLDLVVVLTSNIDQGRYDAENLVGETIVSAIAD